MPYFDSDIIDCFGYSCTCLVGSGFDSCTCLDVAECLEHSSLLVVVVVVPLVSVVVVHTSAVSVHTVVVVVVGGIDVVVVAAADTEPVGCITAVRLAAVRRRAWLGVCCRYCSCCYCCLASVRMWVVGKEQAHLLV